MSDHRILLVEDRPADVRLTKRALAKAGFTGALTVAENGRVALDMLLQRGAYAGTPLPHLILLDWMMPLVNGHEVLIEMRKHEHLKMLPVVVLTTSKSAMDIEAAYADGCNAYLVKPVDPDDFQKTMDALGLFWLSAAVLPGRKSP